jgi:hypothetical protein
MHPTATDLLAQLRSGSLTIETLVRSCLARIETREPDVLAWSYLDPDTAIRAAREMDKQPDKGPLHGLPIALTRISHTTLRLKRIGRQFVTICDNDAEPRRMRLFSVAVSHHRRAGGVGVEHGGSAVSAS